MRKTLEEIRKTYDCPDDLDVLREDMKALERVQSLNFVYVNIETAILDAIQIMLIQRRFELYTIGQGGR